MQTIWIFDFLKYFLPWSKFSIWSPVASPISQGLRLQREWHGFNSRSNIFCISCMTLQILEEFGPPNQPNRRHGIWPKTEPHRTRHNRTGTYPGTNGGEKEPSIMVGANPRYISSFGHCGQLPPCNSRFKCPDSAYWWSHKKKTPPPWKSIACFHSFSCICILHFFIFFLRATHDRFICWDICPFCAAPSEPVFSTLTRIHAANRVHMHPSRVNAFLLISHHDWVLR